MMLKILVLWRKIVEKLIFVYLFCPKTGAIDFTKNLHNSGIVGRRTLPDPSLNHNFNALLIGVQYTVSYQQLILTWSAYIKTGEISYFLCNPIYKMSHWRYSVKDGVLKNFTNFTGKHLYYSLFNNVSGPWQQLY